MERNTPYFAVNEPYELVYRDNVVTNTVSAHTHNVAEIYLTMTDLPDVLLNDMVFQVPRGTLIVIPPFCVHQLFHLENQEYKRYILNVDVCWVESVLLENAMDIEYMKNADIPGVIPLAPNQLLELMIRLNQFLPVQGEHDMKTIAAFFELLSYLTELVQEVGQKNVEPALVVGSQKKVNEVIAYIQENIMEGVTVEEIANHFYLNKDYVSRLFAKHVHTTIGRYVAIQRITIAQRLLRSGKTVQEVQEMMKYSSYAHFFKTFRKLTGISPSQYRNQYMINSKE